MSRVARPESKKRRFMAVLIGNAFPMTLVRRELAIAPMDIRDFRGFLRNVELVSFWGHENTLVAASEFVGRDLTPVGERPVVTLNAAGFPTLHGREFREVFIISPNYDRTVRPGLEKEVDLAGIVDWTVLAMRFK